MVASETRTDIYELLGISPDASPALAREMYWSKVSEYIEADRQGEEGAREAIDSLNEALNIVLDSSLRREYDTAVASPAVSAPDPLAPSTRRIWSVLIGMQLVALVGAGAAWLVWGLLPGLGILFVGTSTTFGAWIGFRQLSPLSGSPFMLLGLDEQATLDDVDLAYESRVQELLVRLHREPAVVSELELIDEAYVRACALIATGESAAMSAPAVSDKPKAEPSAMSRALGWVWSKIAGGVGFVLRLLGGALLWLAVVAVEGVRRGVTAMADWLQSRTSRTPRPVLPEAAPYPYDEEIEDDDVAPAMPGLDVNRRLAAGFKSAAERIAESDARRHSTAAVAEEAVPESAPITSYIVLGSVAGSRRVGIGDSPIKIGTADSCDLVLPEDSGVSPEHALIWRHQDAVVLHVTDHSAACMVNERPMTWATLESGDEVRMGTFKMRIEVEAADGQE